MIKKVGFLLFLLESPLTRSLLHSVRSLRRDEALPEGLSPWGLSGVAGEGDRLLYIVVDVVVVCR